jgi:hypothetical protein
MLRSVAPAGIAGGGRLLSSSSSPGLGAKGGRGAEKERMIEVINHKRPAKCEKRTRFNRLIAGSSSSSFILGRNGWRSSFRKCVYIFTVSCKWDQVLDSAFFGGDTFENHRRPLPSANSLALSYKWSCRFLYKRTHNHNSSFTNVDYSDRLYTIYIYITSITICNYGAAHIRDN